MRKKSQVEWCVSHLERKQVHFFGQSSELNRCFD
jgi:hypothetical protein